MQARFHSYSFNNTILILVQRPTATAWQVSTPGDGLAGIVRRGEQAVWILAPVTRRVADEESDNPMRTVVAIPAGACICAEDQTEGDPLPAVCARLHGDDPQGAYAGLVEVAHSFGFTVEDHAFDGETNGDCSHALHRIRVEVTLEPTHRVKTLAHELAHALLHVDRSERALMELEAESVAFVVCDALGIDAGEWTFGYVAVIYSLAVTALVQNPQVEASAWYSGSRILMSTSSAHASPILALSRSIPSRTNPHFS